MGSTSGWRMAGMEVPLLSTDSVDWRQLSVPSYSSATSTDSNLDDSLSKDFASCCAVGNPPSYFVWKSRKTRSNVLEILELGSSKEVSRIGLQLTFPDALFPFAFIYKDESNSTSGDHLLLYTLTISGVAYLIRLKNNFDYGTSSLVPSNEILGYNTQVHPHNGAITTVAASEGCLSIGRSDGSIGCFQLGALDPSSSGFVYELRDDAGFGRLWGILSRNSTLAAVQDLVMSEVQQRKLLFVLHSDGSFRVWDLLTRSKIFSHVMTVPSLTGAFVRLWVGEANADTDIIPLAMLHRQNLEVSTETIFLYGLRCNVGDKTPLSLEPSLKRISLGEGGPVDVKLTSNNVWILKEEGLIMQDLLCDDFTEGLAHCYALQETFVADQLFQSSEHSSDDLLWLAYSSFSSAKEEVVPFVSSLFLRALLSPGVYCNAVLRQTFGDYNRYFTDSEFGSFTVDGLKSELLSLIEHQGGSTSPVSILKCWKTLCARYVNNWCKYNAACGLLVDPLTGSVGLIRNNTISLCRGLEDVEHIIYGIPEFVYISNYLHELLNSQSSMFFASYSDALSTGLILQGSFEEKNKYIGSGFDSSSDELGRQILFEFLQCVRSVSQQLGKASSAIIYELFLSRPHISSEEVISQFLKVLEIGYSSSTGATLISELGVDTAWERESLNHKNLRKFSANIFLSLHALCHKANSWVKVLDVVESHLKFLVPHKVVLNLDAGAVFHIIDSAIVHSTSQIARVMFESVLDVLMLLSYMTSICGQINMSHDDVSRVKLELIPMIQETLTEWHIIHFFGTTPTESPPIEDFSYKLSSLQIDSNGDKRLWNANLGKCEFSLAYILLFRMQSSSRELRYPSFSRIPNPSSLVSLSREFTSWIIWGRSGEESSIFFSNAIDLAIILLGHNQYKATEYLLTSVDVYSRKEKIFGSLQAADGKYSALFHLLGCCLIAQTHGLHVPDRDRKLREAIRCFFRAASMEGSSKALQTLPREAGWLRVDFSYGSSLSASAWKLQYYQWVMQLFEQYNEGEAASQFAFAALEQVDAALGNMDTSSSENPGESVTSAKGRLWANIFKFSLDLNNYHDAYCAMTSNPDEESRTICLRRFIIVLYERGAVKMLCDGQFPLIGLVEKVERELAWKAERSDISAKPNPFKLLYAFEMHKHNWRRAASYMYIYSVRLRAEAAVKDHQRRSLILQERLNGLAAAINALQLVHPSYAWIEAPVDDISPDKENYPNKKARITKQERSPDDALPQKPPSYLDVEKLEKEFVLTSAEHLLSLANIKWSSTGNNGPSPELIDLLVESYSYDMAFTVILKFWKGSDLKRELERVFITMALTCCPSRLASSLHGKDRKIHGLLLTSSQDEVVQDSLNTAATVQQFAGSSHWETLECYLDKYRALHPRLPFIVAGTLLSADSQMDIPLWLVRHFKGDRNESSIGMTGSESNPASLFCLYVDHGRYTEATNLLIEYIEKLASIRPADVVRRKRPNGVWFPYTSVERLWQLLEESIRLGHRSSEQCEKLKELLHGALSNHLNLLKVDSDDVVTCPNRSSIMAYETI